MTLHPCPLCGESKGYYDCADGGRLTCGACHREVTYMASHQSGDDDAWNAAAAHAQALRECIKVLEAERDQAQQVCAEAYQVVGSLLSDVGQFGTELGDKVLDNLSEHRMVHDDVLPWPSFEAQLAQRVPLTDEQMLACVRSIGLPVPMGLTRDVGPYEVTTPTYFLELLVRAVERAHGIGQSKGGKR